MGLNAKINKGTVIISFVWKILERILSQGINLIVQIILARILLPEDFGSLAIIVAITNYAAIFVQSGLSTAIIQKENVDSLDISTLLSSSLAIAGIFYIAIFLASPYIAIYYGIEELKWALRVLALILFLNAINSIQTAVLSRNMQFRKIFTRTLIAVPIAGIFGIALAYRGLGIWALVVHSLVNMVLIVVFMSFDKELRFSLRFSLTRAKKIYSFSGKILLTSLITGLHDTLRTMVIGKKYSTNDLAYYDKAYTYSGYVTQTIGASISSVLLPTFSRQQNDIESLKKMTRRSVKIASFVMFPVLLGGATISKPLIVLLLTEKWIASVPYLMLFCVLRIPGCIMIIDKQVYFALERSELNLFYEIGLFIVNICTLIVTFQYGTISIAVGATAVEWLGGIALCIISSRVFDYSLIERFRDMLKPFINTLIMTACVWGIVFLRLGDLATISLQIPCGIIGYIGLASITKDERLKYIIKLIKGILKNKTKINK